MIVRILIVRVSSDTTHVTRAYSKGIYPRPKLCLGCSERHSTPPKNEKEKRN